MQPFPGFPQQAAQPVQGFPTYATQQPAPPPFPPMAAQPPALPYAPPAQPPTHVQEPNLDDAPDGIDRLPDVTQGVSGFAIVERVHTVPTRKGKTFVEFIFRVDVSNSKAMPPGHRFHLFQDIGYEGAASIFKAATVAILGHTSESAKAAGVRITEQFQAARGPANIFSGLKVRFFGDVRTPTKGAHVGKRFTELKLSPFREGEILPEYGAAAPAPAAPPPPPFTPPAAAPVAPAQIPPSDLYYDPGTKITWQISTQQIVHRG